MEQKKKLEEHIGVGRRKSAVASVRLRPGSGEVKINGRPMEIYFPTEVQRKQALAALAHVGLTNKYDLVVRMKGGGIQGQVEAMRLGVARALVGEDVERRGDLKHQGFLRRDSRKKERKKYGLAGARKSFQFSKR